MGFSPRRIGFLLGLSMAAITIGAQAAGAQMTNPISVYAAGSLRDALDETARAYEAVSSVKVSVRYGPSGLLKDEIASGAKADMLTSANMEHPAALAQAGRGGPVALFARNSLCALVKPGLAVTPATLLDVMLAPAVKLGTSTPKADPSGDYAWALFRKAETLKPGAFDALDKKALKLMGGAVPAAPAAPGPSLYGTFLTQGQADVFLTYCTGALAAQRDNPAFQIVTVPDSLAVGADYGLTVMRDAAPGAAAFALYILSVDGQRIFAKWGFTAPALPRP